MSRTKCTLHLRLSSSRSSCLACIQTNKYRTGVARIIGLIEVFSSSPVRTATIPLILQYVRSHPASVTAMLGARQESNTNGKKPNVQHRQILCGPGNSYVDSERILCAELVCARSAVMCPLREPTVSYISTTWCSGVHAHFCVRPCNHGNCWA